MRKKAKEIPVERIGNEEQKIAYKSIGWTTLFAAMLACGGADILLKSWGEMAPFGFGVVGILFAGLVSGILVSICGKKYAYAGVLFVIPWIFVAVFENLLRIPDGIRSWAELMLARWKLLIEGGTEILSVQANQKDVFVFTVAATLLIGQLAWMIARSHSLVGSIVFCVFFMLVEMIDGQFDPVATSVLMIVLLALNMSDEGVPVTRICFRWLLGIGALFLVGAFLLPDGEIEAIRQFRTDTGQKIHELRYGEDTLPEGELRKAAKLQEDPKTMLHVQSEQEKNLYLRGFVGSVYQDGVWSVMPDSTYGGENAGLFKWLKSKNFDPLTQVADYYEIGKTDDTPEGNHILYRMDAASRYYMYFPSTLKQVTDGTIKEKQDNRITSRGIIGEKLYAAEEVSGAKPSELMVAADWVSDPTTDKQKEYCEAESVYRQFVYDNYTKADAGLADLIKEIFWENYDTEKDGIYSALTHIREVLKEQEVYTKTPEDVPDTEDPIRYFLTKSHEGNAMLYASTAVEAFRLHGIPARYIEGYYLSENAVANSSDATVSLTGEDAHAWVEVYFDGIGWLPVDVTPGYYYESVALRQMVGTPDMVRKNASLKDNSYDADQVTGADGTATKKQEIFKIAKKTVQALLGVVGILLMLNVFLFVLVEIVRIFAIWLARKSYESAKGEEKIRKAERIIQKYLELWGIEFHLGWNTRETDKKTAELIFSVHEGEYSRVCALLEKSIYGEEELEEYEKRTLKRFMEKISEPGEKCSIRMKLRLRYGFFKMLFI